MDRLRHDHCKTKFENEYLKLKRMEFQSRFADIMETAYPGDFQRIRHSQGDRGCDGYRISDKTVFQVYAPREIRPGEMNKKMEDDFHQALDEFGENMKRWVFVHNDPDGLTPETAVDMIGGLSSKHPEIEIQSCSFNEIWSIVERLEISKIEFLLGCAPTDESLRKLQLKSIVPVLRFIERRAVPSDVPVDPPDPKKLEFNLFRPEVRDMLRFGRRKERLVEDYVDSVRDPEYGESIAVAFRRKYEELKETSLRIDEIFDELRKFAGGDHFHDASQQAAVLAVLSYFFERCDIFENPETE